MLVQHDGFLGIYSHFGAIAPAFVLGKRAVASGEELGVVGNTGVTSGTHLYFEMIVAGRPVDPAPYLHVPQCSDATHHATPLDGLRAAATTVGVPKVHVLFPDVTQPSFFSTGFDPLERH